MFQFSWFDLMNITLASYWTNFGANRAYYLEGRPPSDQPSANEVIFLGKSATGCHSKRWLWIRMDVDSMWWAESVMLCTCGVHVWDDSKDKASPYIIIEEMHWNENSMLQDLGDRIVKNNGSHCTLVDDVDDGKWYLKRQYVCSGTSKSSLQSTHTNTSFIML